MRSVCLVVLSFLAGASVAQARELTFEQRVADYLEKSNALEGLWGRPITAEQPHAETDRMGKDTGSGSRRTS